ncbi:hypothetical protein O181_103046 [Austropuccinia psidii MF-1]|uniref:Uncharacterized protein n=1 Tax=Austropuccinia psidii MF-1 TaxID=1389203 RepID=A0A9Q3PK56_9BASI|nr:hypothetical protein [Austropuccinia psidii MF-1]
MDKNQTVIKSQDVHFVQDELPYKDALKEKSDQSSHEEDFDEPIEPAKNPTLEEEVSTARQPSIIRIRNMLTSNESNWRQQSEKGVLNVEGANNIEKRPHWDWEIQTKAPQDISSEISSDNILNSRTRHQELLTELIQNKKSEKEALKIFALFIEQKNEAFNKTDSLPAIAMYNNTEEENPANITNAKSQLDWFQWKEAYFSELDSIANQGAFDLYEKDDVPKWKTIINTQCEPLRYDHIPKKGHKKYLK